MPTSKILHVCLLDKFIPPFIDFMRTHFDSKNHFFITYGDLGRFPYRADVDSLHITSLWLGGVRLVREMQSAKKIILHGLISVRLVRILFFQPWLLAKCWWVIWGADLYEFKTNSNIRGILREFFRKPVLKNVAHAITDNAGDYRLAREWYGTNAILHRSFSYPSNLFQPLPVVNAEAISDSSAVSLLVGNSADPSNNHREIFQKILPLKGENILIYCPLSYGDVEYAREIVQQGRELFGDKFIPLIDFLPFAKYMSILASVDIAVFAHKRQQGTGTTVSLLGMGKTVYMSQDSTSWEYFKEKSILVFDLANFDLKKLSEAEVELNQKTVKTVFSEAHLVESWRECFDY